MTDVEDARRCAVASCTGPEGEPRHVQGKRMACSACSARGHQHLLDLPRRYVHLRQNLRPGSPGGEKVSGAGFGSSSPVRDAALSAMDEIARWAAEREAVTRTILNLVPRRKAAPERAVISGIALLAGHWEHALEFGVGVTTIEGAGYWHRRTEIILGWDRLVHRLPAPCPYCDVLTLVRKDGDDRVQCSRCNRTWLEAEYRHFVRMLLDEVS